MNTLSFKEAMETNGIRTKETIIADGKLHRCHIEGDKHGSKNGWYICDDQIATYGSWKTGEKHQWRASHLKSLSPAQRKQHEQLLEIARRKRESEQESQYAAAKEKALNIWNQCAPAEGSHPYLKAKGVQSHKLALYQGSLVIPLCDTAGQIHSLQFIDAEGNKRFLSGGRKKGCFFLIGTPSEPLCIAEGYATAASIYEATGQTCVVAFDAGNLKPVALAFRTAFPKAKITICADNDLNTEGNPGVTKATEAAQAIDALLAIAGAQHD